MPEGAIGPLSGIRILDLSRVLAGPFCTMVLGDLGAEVIKVERPDGGDDTREGGPPFAGGESAYFLCVNRNKKSVALDLKSPGGVEAARGLAAASDVLLENFRVGAMGKFGLGYEEVKALNPGIVYCSITGYGQTGPYRDLAGYDFIMDAAVSWLANVGSNHLVSGEVPGRYGNAHANIVPYQVFRARDRYLAVGIGNDGQWRKFCEIAGEPGLSSDFRFASNPDRVRNRPELIPRLEEVFRRRDADTWIGSLRKEGIPAGPINTVDRVFADPHTVARGMVVEMDHPTAGKVRLIGSPLKLSGTPVEYRLAPPLLGEHTATVLRELLEGGDP